MAAAIAGCQQAVSNGERHAVVPVDNSITSENAFINRFLDSASVHAFIGSQSMRGADSIRFLNFYRSRNYQYAWFDSSGLTELAPNFMNLMRSYRESVDDSALLVPELDTLFDQWVSGEGLTQEMAGQSGRTELLLTQVFFRFADRAYAGNHQINLKDLGWYIPRKKLEADDLLDSLLRHPGNVRDLMPVHPLFERMRVALRQLREAEQSGRWEALQVSKPALRKGDSGAAVVKLKNQLALWGDAMPGDTGTEFTSLTDSAIRKFQARHGLPADGVAGAACIEAMNVPPKKRIEQLLINIERARWLPRPGTGRYLAVNIPEFRLHIFDSGRRVKSMNVVVGKPATNTVIFSANMKYVVFSPYWNVPYSIVKNEMGRSASYFARRNMEIVGRYADGLPMVRQKPGPNNSLGRVKFLFPNSYSIYLHDTPAKNLFGETRRAFSHGCIRIAEPEWLANYLLDDQPEWTPDKIREAMNADKEKTVTLTREVPVFIAYFTAWVDDAGTLQFRPDLYGHDEKMRKRLFPAQ